MGIRVNNTRRFLANLASSKLRIRVRSCSCNGGNKLQIPWWQDRSGSNHR